MKKSKILIVSDMCGYGKVAAAAQMPIFSYMGHDVFTLPTMLISNTFPYGKYAIMESTSYIKEALEKWEELGFRFDAITTGFMASEEQAQMVAQYCRKQAARGTVVFVDPVMGDYGKLYGGADERTIACMREMLRVAHLCFPNYTEACLLTDMPYHEEGITSEEAEELVDKVRKIGARSVIITSCIVNGEHAVVGYNHYSDTHFLLPYEEIPVAFPGTGDIFSSIIVGRLQDGDMLKNATRYAMDMLHHWIDMNKDNEDKNRGIPIERHLSEL
ncbi:MAG: pyridoxamine kinase [Prevotella sp.]|nr:pyridoxamine kinase [Prevotella sp.]MBR4651257.1 pyridoxamine kinase [Prevotella sp.]